MTKLYRIGLDIGIGSVGWSVLENDPVTEEPVQIIDLGVRTFASNEIPNTGESTAKGRREARSVRRRNRRRKFRFDRVRNILSNCFGENIFNDIELINNKDVYELRSRALDEKLSNAELSKVVLQILKRRGFKSNRKNLAVDGDEGKLLTAIKENEVFLAEHGYRTIGEAIYKDDRFKNESCGKMIYSVRNHSGDYKNCFSRADLKKELELILNTQIKLGNTNLTDESIGKIIEIFEKQRNFDEGPGGESPYSAKFEIGNCTFIKNEKRAPKASYTFELFSALSKINSLRVDSEELSFDQKQKIYDYSLEKEKVTFAQIRKILDIEPSQIFNLCRYNVKKKKWNDEISEENIIETSEKAVFVSMKNSYSIKKSLLLETMQENADIIDEVALCLSTCKSDDRIDEYIENNDILNKLSDSQKENIHGLNFDKFGSLSIKAMKQIINHLFNGERYDIACKSAGFNHSIFGSEKTRYLKGEEVDESLKNITSPVVKRAVNQTIRVLNEIIKRYGSPQYVIIELARELSKDFKERRNIENRQKDNAARNEDIIKRLEEEFHITKPGGLDIIKLRLYDEQGGKCMYSGKPFETHRLFESNYTQVDHILPFSRSMDDSYNNKVLVLSSENQDKGGKTPYEFFGSDEKKWNDFVARVNLLTNRTKKRFLLNKKFGENEQNEFIERNLNDTKYIAKFMLNLMQDHLKLTPSLKYKERAQVKSVNGAITSYLRKFWGINKLREDGDIHHAIDATVISTVTPGQVQKITKFNKYKEKFVFHDGKTINRKTGEVISIEEMEEFKQAEIDMEAQKLPYPYPHFLKELEIRSKVKYISLEFDDEEKYELAKIGYSDEELLAAKPVFVSRMKTVKMTGPIHKETIMSSRDYKETKKFIKTVKIQDLKLEQKEEIEPFKEDKYPEFSIQDYYRPKDDKLLYLKLKEIMHENGGRVPDSMVVHKPRKDGTDGPIVKTVKTYVNKKCYVFSNGAAENGAMHRVDVFEKEGKFYLCPVYMSDVYAKKLPNKVIVRNKDWINIDNTFNFKFSLYQNDLIKIKSGKEIKISKNFNNPKSKKPDELKNNEFMIYYNSTGIFAASIKVLTHDDCYKIESLGVKTLKSIEKYYVDIMGKIYKAQCEERKGF